MTMSKGTTYIRYYFDRGEWRMTKDRCVLRTGRGLDSAIAAEKELKAAGIPVRFMFIEGWKIYCFFRKKRLTSCPNRLYGEKGKTMNTMRKNLIDRMVKIYGFEHPVVIQFTDLCERWKDTKDNDKVLRIIVESHEEFPVLE